MLIRGRPKTSYIDVYMIAMIHSSFSKGLCAGSGPLKTRHK